MPSLFLSLCPELPCPTSCSCRHESVHQKWRSAALQAALLETSLLLRYF